MADGGNGANGASTEPEPGREPAGRPARTARHETRALLRAHLSAAAGRGPHLTRHCAVCNRLLRLALESRESREKR